MSDPRRLLDDPDASSELRNSLAAEARRALQYDATELGARVANAVAAGAPLGATSLGASSLGSGALFGPKALLATALVSAALGAGGHALYAARAGDAAPVAPVVALPEVAPVPAATPTPVVATVPAPLVAAPTSPPVAERKGVAPRSALVDELRLYERGEAALLEGHYDVAARELRRYLAEHPKGTLRAEAELGLVQALGRSGRCEEAHARAERASPAAHRQALRAAAASCVPATHE